MLSAIAHNHLVHPCRKLPLKRTAKLAINTTTPTMK
jgi:hypothetical protein